MRAFMSVGGRRHYIVEPDEDGICNILPGITPTRTREEKQALALDEARRILAETEPRRLTCDTLTGLRWFRPNTGRALADALRAFVEEGK